MLHNDALTDGKFREAVNDCERIWLSMEPRCGEKHEYSCPRWNRTQFRVEASALGQQRARYSRHNGREVTREDHIDDLTCASLCWRGCDSSRTDDTRSDFTKKRCVPSRRFARLAHLSSVLLRLFLSSI